MKVRLLAGTGGLGVVYNKATRSVIVAVLAWGWSFSFPRPGACKFCGHGPELHAARREGRMVEWSCHGSKATCECEHYTPVGLK